MSPRVTLAAAQARSTRDVLIRTTGRSGLEHWLVGTQGKPARPACGATLGYWLSLWTVRG